MNIRTRHGTRMFELSDQEFKVTVINVLRDLINKIDSMQEQAGSVCGEMEILRKKVDKELNTVPEMKNTFDGLISRLDM